MSIDWSKYGVGNDNSSKSESTGMKTNVDFSKYLDTSPHFSPADQEQSSAKANQEVLDAPSTTSTSQGESSQPFSPDENIFQKALDVVGMPSRWIAAHMVPDAPLIGTREDGTYGNLPGTNAQTDYNARNPVPSTGNATVDKIGNAFGSLVGPMVGTMGTGASAIPSIIDNGLAQAGVDFSKYLGGKVAKGAVTGALTGAPLNAAATLATTDPTLNDLAQSADQGALLGGALGAVGGAIGAGASKLANSLADKYAGTKIGDALGKLLGRSQEVAPESEQATQNAIQDYTAMQQYKNPVEVPTSDDVRSQILQEVSQRTTPPLENPKLLDKYLTQHLGEDIPKSEIQGLSYNDKAELAQYVSDNLSQHDIASQIAKEKGYNWDELLGSTDSRPAQSEITVTNAPNEPVTNPSASAAEIPVQRSQTPVALTEASSANARTEIKPAQPTVQGMRERGHTASVRTSDMSPESLRQVFEQPELYKTRSTQKLFEDAQKFIQKNGQQEAYDFVMNAKKMTDKHNAVAQILSKQLANSGDISRAIDVVSKTAKSGTELGRAIQALSLWNRMDTEGALMIAQRQINRGNTGEYRALTAEQAKPIVDATQKIQQVQQAKSLADEVAQIVANKQPGEKLTDDELAKIQQFQKQVNDLQGQVKKFLPGEKEAKPRKVIEEVNKIDPKERTRDQVVNFLDAKAELARKRIQASRNRISSTPLDIYADYAIIGASKLAKGFVNLADFTEQMVQEVGEKVRPIINQVYNEAMNRFRRSQGLPTTNDLNRLVSRAVKERELDPESAAEFKNWANKIAFYTDDNLRTEAVQDLQLAMKRLEKSTLGQKISSLQAGMQLLSIPTTVRNVIGNEAFNALEKVNKMTAIPIDWAASKLTGERSIIFDPQNQEKYWQNWFKGAEAGWLGVSPNGKLSSYDIRPEVFGQRNILKYVTKLTGAELQSFDHAAYMRAYGDVLATYAEQLGKSQGMNGKTLKEAIPSLIKQLDQSIHDMADEAGRYATFQDDTALSKAAEAVKRGLNYPTKLVGDKLVKIGVLPEKLNPSGFGLGDVVLKYAKTPANIVMRAIDYSPIGIFRGLMEIFPILSKKEFNQRQAVLALSRGITGTLGLTGLGYYLASQGILSGASSGDKDVKALQDAAGKKGYQVNLSALQRWIMSGLDKNAAKFQNGDKLINYDWLQPMAISLAMGVDMNQAQNEKKAGVSKTGVQIAGSMILGGLKSIMNQPLVQGVQQVADATGQVFKQGSWNGVWNIFKGVPASFVPSIVGQVRNFTDNTARSTYDPNALKSMINMVMNKIPGLAEKLPPQIDSLSGKPKSVVDGGQAGTVGQSLNVFLNPAKVTQYHVSPEAAMVVQLINDTGETKVAPRVPNRYLTIDKKKVDLTPGQYLQLQQSTSQYTADRLQRISPMLTNPNVPDNRKVDAVVKVLNDAGTRARAQLERTYPELRPKKVK